MTFFFWNKVLNFQKRTMPVDIAINKHKKLHKYKRWVKTGTFYSLNFLSWKLSLNVVYNFKMGRNFLTTYWHPDQRFRTNIFTLLFSRFEISVHEIFCYQYYLRTKTTTWVWSHDFYWRYFLVCNSFLKSSFILLYNLRSWSLVKMHLIKRQCGNYRPDYYFSKIQVAKLMK